MNQYANNGVPDSLMPDPVPPSNDIRNTAVGVPESIEISEESPDVSQEHEPQEVAFQQHRSTVNGLGMWSAWERNFSNKLKASLDLVDNAVDAALWNSDDEDEEEEERKIRGRPLTERERWEKQSVNIHISTEKHRLAMEYYDSDDDDYETDGDHQQDMEGKDAFRTLGSDSEDPDADEKTGDFRLIDEENTLCLHNDCVKPVKELRKILDVYNSDKTESAIGENGVGVKQAAAAMSDLSIVVTTRIDEEPLLMDYGDHSNQRIRKVLVSVGVLAKKMQSADACMIPSWTLPIEFDIDEQRKKENNANGVDDEGELGKHFAGNSCIPVLMRELFKITDSSFLFMKVMKEFGRAAVKNRRLYAMRRLAKHIELMIMSFKKKNKELKPPHPHQYLMLLHKFGKHKSSRKEENRNASIVKARNDLDDLLRDLTYEVPRTYLHIPPAPYLKFRVNQKLLKFQYWESSLVELHQIPLVVDRRNDFRTAEDWLIPERDEDTYDIKVSIGFDPSRAGLQSNNFIGGQACSLLIFSRISGRLFLKHDDARGVLRLQNSGTNFCQGLTIIVDDFEGHLPLTPTKEALAFGMEDYGQVHERNLYAWLGALATVYWNHFHTVFKTKRALGNAVRNQNHRVNQLKEKRGSDLPTLRFGKFSTVTKLCFSRERVKDSIRPYKSEYTSWTHGPHTLISLSDPIPKKKTKAVTRKRKAVDLSSNEIHDSDSNDLTNGAPPSSALENGPSEESLGQNDNEELFERLDGRPRRATREPQRFQAMPANLERQKEMLSRSRYKSRYKSVSKDDKAGEVDLKKKLREVESVLLETQLELNASKAICDDLQIQLDEVEQTGSNQIIELETKLKEIDARHKAELLRLEADYIKRSEAIRIQVLELEGKRVQHE